MASFHCKCGHRLFFDYRLSPLALVTDVTVQLDGGGERRGGRGIGRRVVDEENGGRVGEKRGKRGVCVCAC